jgi:replicative DNA helicase
VEYYAQIVQDCSLRRAMISLTGHVGAEAYNDSVDSRLLLEETQQKLFDLSDTRQIYNYKGAREIIKDAIQFIKNAYSLKKEITGIPSGFDALDRITAGFQPAELIIIGARPGMGKTAIALTMAANISLRKKIPAAFFSLEMSDQSLMLRLISAEARIDSKKLRIGQITSSGFTDIWQAAEDINAAPLFFVDIPNMRITDIRAMSRRLRLQEKVEIIFIDYIGLIASDNNKIPRWEQISEVSRSLKSLARELGIPIVALSQLRREAEQAKQPSLADIRESGSIEQDADMVMLINRNRELEKTPEEQSQEAGQEVELLVAKNRNGMVGKVNLVFLRQYTRFENLAVERI